MTVTRASGSRPDSADRFAFGANWTRFLSVLTEERIAEAEASMRSLLETKDLKGLRLLDVGSGSGLFSLAARRLGARVHSFDFDPQSVACTRELRRRYLPDDADWVVEQGSILDEAYIRSLGTFDVVYAWGVLHHTGSMSRAMELAAIPVRADGGKLYLSLYNRQSDLRVRLNTAMKRTYVRSPKPVKVALASAYGAFSFGRQALYDLLSGRNPMAQVRDYKKSRGMSWWHDVVDWVGGYPYEVSAPEEVLQFYRSRGFWLLQLITVGAGHGCNQFVFLRRDS